MTPFRILLCAGALAMAGGAATAQEICTGYGPQTPRDITSAHGTNQRLFALAHPASAMNLCNIHFHGQAEHKGPGFSQFAGTGEHGGYQCNETGSLTAAELEDPTGGHGACHGVEPGDTIEVHWVYTSCDVSPGEGLGACLSDKCANPALRVESQMFLVANDPQALEFTDFTYPGAATDGLHQARALPTGTGEPVVFAGSTTGPKYTEQACSPLHVTWSVRPTCARVDVSSLHGWCGGNVLEEDHAHGACGERNPLLQSRKLALASSTTSSPRPLSTAFSM